MLTDDSGTPEPAEPTGRNGALVIANGAHVVAVLEGDGEFKEPVGPDPLRGPLVHRRRRGDRVQNLEQKIVARNVATRETRVLGHCEVQAICRYALSPDEQWLAQVDWDRGLLTQVGGRTGAPSRTVDDAADIAWSPEGDRLAVAGWNGVQVIDVDETIPDTLVARGGRNQELPPRRLVPRRPDRGVRGDVEAPRPPTTYPPSTYVLRVVPVDGHEATSVADLGACFCTVGPVPSFAWAPDGSALAYTRVTGPVAQRPPRRRTSDPAGRHRAREVVRRRGIARLAARRLGLIRQSQTTFSQPG